MSVTWSRDLDGNDWGSIRSMPRGPAKRTVTSTKTINLSNSNKEGYSGNPTTFVDIDDPRISAVQRKYRSAGAAAFRKNMPLVSDLIQSGVVMPTGKMMENVVNKVRKIANGG